MACMRGVEQVKDECRPAGKVAATQFTFDRCNLRAVDDRAAVGTLRYRRPLRRNR